MSLYSKRIRYYYYLALLCIAAGFAACQYQGTTQSGSYKMLYDLQSSVLHPQYIVYHFSNDSSRVYYKVKSDELLYSRVTADAPFQAKFKIQCTSYAETGELDDSVSVVITDQSRSTAGWLIGSVDFRMNNSVRNLVIECSDLKKNTFQTNYITAYKTNTYSDQNYLLCDAHNGEPIFNRFLPSDQVLKIVSARNEQAQKDIAVLHYPDSIHLPPPPFAPSDPEMPNLSISTPEETEKDSTGFYFLLERGMYVITSDPEKKTGALVSTSSEYFPDVKGLTQLTPPLRYITSKVEYEEISSHYFPKIKVDELWLEFGGSKERARDLIRIFYNRVQEANYYFSSYTEGWRTDRGMIHVVFGNPTRIVKQQTYETWIYGEEGQSGTLTFVFKKEENSPHQNVFILNRDPGFKQFWEKQVTAWRSGRIYND